MTFSPANPPQLVIFDNDGVLIDSEVIAATSTAQALAERGYNLSVDEVMHAFIGMSFKDTKIAMAARGIEADQSFDDRCQQIFLAMVDEQLEAIEGAAALVAAIKRANIPVCVCSNANLEWLTSTHRKVGLSDVLNPLHYFHRDMVEHPKPAPDMHLMALDSFGISADKALIIEDSTVGARGGIAAGITVWGFVGASGVSPSRAQELLDVGCGKTFDKLSQIRHEILS